MKVFNQHDGINFLISSLKKNTIVPIIGSGFTFGAQASSGVVLNGLELEEKMKDVIYTYSQTYKYHNLDNLSFNDISEIFFDEDDVPLDIRHAIIKNHFTSVKLEKYKTDFLKLWRYIYTINIDDGIENSTQYKTILPYTSLRKNYNNILKEVKYVLKLHGDANHELVSEEANNIIFSSEQYITSLMSKDNQQLISSIYSDYKQKNLIFIGCSLKNEPDLKQIYKNAKNDIFSTYIIYLCNKYPEKDDEKRLKKYGINTILKVDNYDSFYKNIVSEFNKDISNLEAQSYRFRNPKTNILRSKDAVLEIFSHGKQVFNVKSGYFNVPICKINRYVINDILRAKDSYSFIFVKGRRLSGKTLLLQTLIERMPSYEILFFPSDYAANDGTVTELLDNAEQTVFIFDSNSITPEIYQLLLSKKKYISKNNNKVFIVSNTNEDFLITCLQAYYVELPNFFNQYEIDEFNEYADRFAFIKRNRMQTNLEYSYNLLKQHNMEKGFMQYDISTMSDNQKKLMYMLCVFDRVYTHEALSIGVSQKDIANFIEQYPVLFERVDCDPNESDGKSVFKIVHNSKSIILNLISNMKNEDVVLSVKAIVQNLYVYDKEQYKSAILFETFNQLFGKDGAGHLIEYIYQELENELYSEPHFWLQRAKSIYRLFKRDKEKLIQATIYSKKVIDDSRSGSNLYIKAAFTSSLIHCMLYNIEKNEGEKNIYQINSINFAYTSIFTKGFSYIPVSIKKDIFQESKFSGPAYKNLVNLCEDFLTSQNKMNHAIISNRALDIINGLNDMKKMYENIHPRV